MSGGPTGKKTHCPACDSETFAILPSGSEIIEEEEAESDGKTWVNCLDCRERFLVYFRRTE